MQKVSYKFKKLITIICLGVVFLLSGLFFVGCGESPASKLTITPDKTNISIFVGESADVTFTLGNYEKGVDGALSFALIDSTVASATSEHVSLQIISQEETQTIVRVTGISGGSTKLVATSREGNKQAFVSIEVRQYSSSVALKDEQLLYVTQDSPFVPNENMYKFDSNSTERTLTFHKTELASEISDENAFVSANLTYDNDTQQYILSFVKENGETFGSSVVSLGTQINFMARYENAQTLKIESVLAYFTVLPSLPENSIEIIVDDEPVNIQDGITIIANDNDGADVVDFIVRVPSYIQNSGTVYEENFITFEDKAENSSLLTITKQLANQGDPLFKENFATYRYQVSSATIQAITTNLNFKLYYSIGDQSFENANDSSVSQNLQLPVLIRVAPENIVVNGYEQTAPENNYHFYNYYDGDYGWQEFKIDVYRTDSSFDYVLVTFGNDVIVKYQNKTVSSPFKVYNINEPIFIRGASSVGESTQSKQIKFEVVSDYISQDTNSVVYSVNYTISTGATSLVFDDAGVPYEYYENNENSGVFVSSSSQAEIFAHLVSDYAFKSVTPLFYSGDEGSVIVEYIDAELVEFETEQNTVCLKITPRKTGIATYKIMLDNGVSKLVTFRVINTFDSLSVNIAGTENNGVLSYEKVEPSIDPELGQLNDEMNIILQNSSSIDANNQPIITYGKNATVELTSSNGKQIFDNITYKFTNGNILSIAQNGNAVYTVSTNSFGETVLDFAVKGVVVDKDFIKQTTTKYARVNFVSTVPVSQFNLNVAGSDISASSVSLYVGNNISDSSLQTTSFTSTISPSNAYGFYNPLTDEMINDTFKTQYIYWTLNDTTLCFNATNNELADKMVYGNIYKIGISASNYFGLFDTNTMTFTVNPNYGYEFSFTMFASLRQYGISKYFPINIQGQAYDNVSNIYTNLDQDVQFVFSPSETTFQVAVFLNPNNATDKDIVVRYISTNADIDDPLLINLSDVLYSKTSQNNQNVSITKINDNGTWLISVELNESVSNADNSNFSQLSGVLQIIPNAWFVNEKIISGYENSIVSITFNYENGTIANPFWIQNAQDLINIGQSSAAMKAHYRLETTIDLSSYTDQLPLGKNITKQEDRVFSGSIISLTGDAVITGINIKNGVDNNFGLFPQISGNISGIKFEGSINVETTNNNVNVGLVCGILTKDGILGGDFNNSNITFTGSISAKILSSNISVVSGNIGGLVGQNKGLIKNMNVLFDGQMLVKASKEYSDNTFVAGIAGTSAGGKINGRSEDERADLFGYSAYSVYALISVQDYSGELTGNASSVVAVSSGEITQILAGGEIFANSVGGIVRTMTAGKLEDITTRVFVRGNEIALVGVKVEANVTLPETASSIKIQATDDGVHLGIYASMGVLFANTSSYTGSKQEQLDKIAFYLPKLSEDSEAQISCGNFAEFSSYITRQEVKQSTSIKENFTLDQFYADFIVVNSATESVIYKFNFEDASTALSIHPNSDNGFYAYSSTDGNTNVNVINMYYFEASGSYQNGAFTTSNLHLAQQALSPLNTLNIGDSLYPIIIEGSDLNMTSLSANLEISETGQIVVKGTGLAKVEISSLLNQKENEIIYFNVINYFNVQSYKIENDIVQDGEIVLAKETGIFTIGNLTLGQNASFNVYSNGGVDVLISPSYLLNTQINSQSVSISRDGLVTINGNLIQLAKNYSVSASVSVADSDADKQLTYGAYVDSRDGLTFVKTSQSTTTSTMQDIINLSAAIIVDVEGKTYQLEITTLKNVSINYYEGATAINTKKDRYVLTPSSGDNDLIVITSDDKNDSLVADLVEGLYELEVVDEEGKTTDLFNAFVSKASSLKFNLNISVDKTSTAFKNRQTENIYKTYYLNLKAKSNPNTALKVIEISLHQENVDTIIVNNFPSLSEIKDSNFVVPGRVGVFSITLSPIDADFDYVEINNNAINSLQGSSIASFVLGTYESTTGTFIEISGSEITSHGIRISRQVLESIDGYQGQFYVRYMFSNNSVVDGQNVAIDVSVIQNGGVFSNTFSYQIYKQEFVSVDFAEYPGKTEVARGLSYLLNVQAVGYDNIQLTTSNPQLAQIVKDEQTGYYQLVVTNDAINYQANKNTFSILLTASRVNEFGQEVPANDEINITILEYVINYNYYDANGNPVNLDIISNMSNGVIDIALGEKARLSVTFGDLIEYNVNNTTVVALVNNFLNQLTTNGKWTIYTDLNVNNESGIPVHSIPLKKSDSTASILTSNNSLTIPYLKTEGLTLTPLRTQQISSRRYFLSFESYYKINNGVYEFVSESEATGGGVKPIYTEFDINAFMRGSEQSPNPITSYDEFLEMLPGGYYILLNDIEIPAESFVPLDTQIAYLDGNNYKFIFNDSQYSIGSIGQAGLFANVSTSTVLKNITLEIGSADISAVSFTSSASTAVIFGLVAGVNNGSITNASVQTHSNTTVYLTFTSTPATEGYYFGGISGQNTGFISNSRVNIKAQSLISMGGVAGVNQGTIASSAFKEGMIICNSTYNNIFVMGGLVATNSENAKILTSYVSGNVTSNKVYADGTESMLDSSVQVGGFVHTNQGIIEDCYSNIPILTSSRSAGFAYSNVASIERCFSTSKIIGDNSATNYYFAGEGDGVFEDCYYIRGNKINITLSPLSHEGVTQLTYNENDSGEVTLNDFANLTTYFANYSYSSVPSYSSVWFYSDGTTGDKFDGMQFAGGRLELVSANIIASSQKENIGTTTDANGVLIYQYITAENTPEDGSVFNPYIIYSPETMENYLNSPNKIASGNYRIINDINYASLPSDYTNLYSVNLSGCLEGNGATISGIQLSSSAASQSAGLFANIYGSTSANACVMNLTVVPQEVAFTNSNIVGALAGTIQNANLYNIKIYGSTSGMETTEADEIVTVTGKNIVGGVIGLALGNYDIKNIDSVIGAFATNVPATSATNDYESEDLSKLSFAGGVIGYLGGRGKISGTNISRGALNILGAKAGLAFGGIAKSVSASNVVVAINSSMKISAYKYGGFIAGEVKGSLSNVYVYSYGVTSATFSLTPYVADAIGGIAGLLRNGGTISMAYMQQGFIIGNQPTATVVINTVDSIGGIVGKVEGNNNSISQVIVDGNIVARNVLGGVVGEISGQVSISQAAVKSSSLKIEGQLARPIIGGIVGFVNQNSIVSVSDSYSQVATIIIDTYTYSSAITAFFGGIIGNNSGSSLTLNNIYSTSAYNITVEDNNSSDATAQVYGVQFGADHPSYILQSGEGLQQMDRYFAIGQRTYANLEDWEHKEDEEISYSIIQSSDLKLSNVYNSSIAGSVTTVGDADILNQGYTTIFAKKYNSDISLTQNEYGTDLYTNFGDTAIQPLAKTLQSFYNLFKNNSLWETSASGFSVLSFEKSLL